MNRVTPTIMGAAAAVMAVAAQAFLWLEPPPAYGLCVVCHGRDLVVWLISTLTGGPMNVAAVSANWPLLTVVGIFLGSGYAARVHGEYHVHWAEHPLAAFVCGAAVMIIGLIIMACPARLLLRAAYGDLIAAAGAISMLVGVIAATLVMRWRAGKC